MNTKHRNIIKNDAQYTRIYENMRGVDVAAADAAPTERYAYSENMYIDYEGDGLAVESVPGFRKIYSFGKKINGIYTQNLDTGVVFLLVHAADALYRISEDEIDDLAIAEPLATLADKKSCSYAVGRRIYILDGERILAVDENGRCETVAEDAENAPYVPLTHRNGEEYEERNLLTDKFRESFNVSASEEFSFGTHGLKYSIINALEKTCALIGADESVSGSVHIPSYVKIGGETYAVTEIAQTALWGKSKITEIVTNRRLKKISRYAFWNMTGLERLILGADVESIEEYALYGCSALNYLYIGPSFKKFGTAALSGTTSLFEINYAADMNSFELIENRAVLTDRQINYHVERHEISIGLKLTTPTLSVERVTINGESKEFSFTRESATVRLDFANRDALEGRAITVYATADNEGFTTECAKGDYLTTSIGGRLSPDACILGCSVTEIFNGRVFLSGNPVLAGSVFYNTSPVGEEPHPLYFGSKSYFIDGVNDHPVKSILSSHGALAVFKSGDDASGSIFYHTPSQRSDKEFETSYIHSRINVLGHAYNYLDESVFITADGVCMLDKGSSYGYREVRKRSSAVDKLLIGEINEESDVAEWLGYLAISANGKIFLADSRRRYSKNNNQEYEWFILSGIGTYKNATRVYRYSEDAPSGYYVHERVGKIAGKTVYSYMPNSQTIYYYTVENGRKYSVYPTDEYHGGDFSGATLLHSVGKRLYFATGSGDLCVFNNDKRGVVPQRIAEAEGFDPEEYARTMGTKLHPDFYLFSGHVPKYSLITAWDDCGVPYLAKSTIGNSLVIKCKTFTRGGINVEIGSDTEGARRFECETLAATDFSDMDFSSLSFSSADKHTVAVNDRSHGYSEKRIAVYTDDSHCPFGIYSISYRYKIKGKIKRKDLI